MLTLVIDKKQK